MNMPVSMFETWILTWSRFAAVRGTDAHRRKIEGSAGRNHQAAEGKKVSRRCGWGQLVPAGNDRPRGQHPPVVGLSLRARRATPRDRVGPAAHGEPTDGASEGARSPSAAARPRRPADRKAQGASARVHFFNSTLSQIHPELLKCFFDNR